MTSASVATVRRAGNIIAVTGSKGGVGKSNLVINLAVSLGRCGQRVLVIDGDLGLANLDVLLGLVPERTVEHLVRGEAPLEELLIEGPSGIRILPAACGVPRLSSLDRDSRVRLLGLLNRATEWADEVLVDTGAGLGETTLSLQLAASRIVAVTTAEPTSLVDTYASIKILWDTEPDKRIDLVVNNVESEQEAHRAHAQIATACRHFLGREPGWLGTVYHDPELLSAVRSQRALAELYPTSRAARCYERIALRLALRPERSTSSWKELAPAHEEGPWH
jgi:flagellar biosynthesis protein FlhG